MRYLLIFALAVSTFAQDGTELFNQRQAIGRDHRNYKTLEIGGVEMRMEAIPWYRTFNPPAWTMKVSFAEHYSATDNPGGFLWEPSCQVTTPGQVGTEFVGGAERDGFTLRVPGDIEAFSWKCEGMTKLSQREIEKLPMIKEKR